MKENFIKIFEQFKKDLHRLDLTLDNNKIKDYKKVVAYLYTKLEIEEARYCIYFLTQISLADLLIEETLKKEKNSFLVDDNGYDVKICTEKKIITIEKRFKNTCIMDYTDEYVMDFIDLHIFYDLKEKINVYFWEYNLKHEKSTPVVVEFKDINFV